MRVLIFKFVFFMNIFPSSPIPHKINLEIGTTKIPSEPKLDILSYEKERIKRLPKHNSSQSFRTFALIQGDSFISETTYEGQTIGEQLAYWNSCLKCWHDPSSTIPFHPDIEKNALSEISNDFGNFADMVKKFKKGTPEEIRKLISKQLDENHHCIIPLETHGVKGGDGHVFSCVLDQSEDGMISVTILNAGAGSEAHPLAAIDNHCKRSYMFPPIEFDNKNFFNEPELACHLIKLICDYSRLEPVLDHDPKEIYQLLLSFGKPISINLSEKAIQAQRSGTCPAKAMKIAARHYFLKNRNLKDYKKFAFYLKLQSFYDMYAMLQNSKITNESDLKLVSRSISQFAYNIEKMKNKSPRIIDDQTLLAAQALLELINEVLPSQKFKEAAINFDETGQVAFQISPHKQKESKNIAIKEKRLSPSFNVPSFKTPDPKMLKEFLLQIKDTDDDALITSIGISSMEIIKCLPIPLAGVNNPYWDEIPENDRLEIIMLLTKLVCNANRYANKIGENRGLSLLAPMFMIQTAAFTMIDFLARKNPQMQLQGFSYDLPLKEINKKNIFLFGDDIIRYKQITKYFSKLNSDHVIFDFKPPIWNRLELENYDKEFASHSSNINGLGGHLSYLDRLLKDEGPKKSWEYLTLVGNYQFDKESDRNFYRKNEFQALRAQIPDEYYMLQKAFFGVKSYFIKNSLSIQNSTKNSLGMQNFSKEDLTINGTPFHLDDPFDHDSVITFNSSERVEDEFKFKKPLKEINSKLDENNKIINLLNEDLSKFSANIISDLHKIMKDSSTRATLAMKFAEDYPEVMDIQEVQTIIQYAFLNDQSIMKQLKTEPLYTSILYKFLDKMILRSSANPSKNELIYWIKLSIFIETQINEVNKTESQDRFKYLLRKCDECLQSSEKKPDNTEQCKLYRLKMLIASVSKKELDPNKDVTLIKEIIINNLLFNSDTDFNDDDIKLTHIMKEYFIKHSSAIKAYIDSFPHGAINAILSEFGIATIPENENIAIKWPSYSAKNSENKQVVIEFPRIYVDNEEVLLGSWPSEIRNAPIVQKLLQNKYPPILKMKKGNATNYTTKVMAKDNSFEICDTNGDLEFKKKFKINNREVFLLHVEFQKLGIADLKNFAKNKEFWKDNDSGVIWMLDDELQPVAQILADPSKPENVKIQKVDRFWQPQLDQFLVQLTENSPLASCFKGIFIPDNLISWGTEKGEVNQINFPFQNLTFDLKKIDGSTKGVYKTNSAYSIASSDEISNPLSTAIYLENIKNSDKKGMILPFTQIKTKDFGSAARNDAIIENNHFFYELDLKSGLWHSSSQLAMLYLIYAYQRHGMYDLAAQYLNHFKPSSSFNKEQMDLLNEIMQNNSDVRSVSIAVKAFLTYINATKLSSFEGITPQTINQDLMELFMENADRLVQLMGDNLALNKVFYSPTPFEIFKVIEKETFVKYPNLNRFKLRINDLEFLDTKPINLILYHPDLPSDMSFHLDYNDRKASKYTIIDNDDKASSKFINELVKISENTTITDSYNFVMNNNATVAQICDHYFGIILKKEFTTFDKQCLEIELPIVLSRIENPEKHRVLDILYYAAKFPDEFRDCLKQEISEKSINSFLNLKKVKENSAKKNQNRVRSDHIIPKKLDYSLNKPPNDESPFHLEFSNWKSLKKIFRFPLSSLMKEFLNSKETKVFTDHEFLLSKSDATNKMDDLAKSNLHELQNAFNRKVSKVFFEYQLNLDKTPSQLIETINGKNGVIHQSKKAIETINEQIQKIFDFPSNEELASLSFEQQQAVINHRNIVMQGKAQTPSLQNHLLPSFLLQKPGILKEVNPFLSDEHIHKLYDLVILYMLEHSRIDQASEALVLIKEALKNPENASKLLHQGGMILAKERHYNPYEYPEMLIYEYATGNMLRNQPDQARLLKKIIKTLFAKDITSEKRNDLLNRLFFEFQAGGGKTKVLSVILAARAQREGKVPIFFSLPALFDIVKEDLRPSLQLVYQLGAVPISIPLGGVIDVNKLHHIITQKGISIVTTPETWHSLRLFRQHALANNIETDHIDAIFEFLQKECMFFIDEEHRNVSSLTEANTAAGSPSIYPSYGIEIITKAYDALYGWIDKPIKLSNGKFLHEELGLLQNKQVSISPKIQEEILRTLAEYMMGFLQIPEDRHQEFFNYIINDKSHIPVFDQELKNNNKNLEKTESIDQNFWKKIDLVKGLIGTLLPHAFSQKEMMDYGPPSNPEDDIFDPYILREPAGSKFQDPDVAVTLTVQGLRQHGLSESQVKRFIKLKLSILLNARNKNFDEFIKLVNELKMLYYSKNHPWESLTFKDLENPSIIAEYTQALGKNRFVIAEFEKEIALKKVKIYPYKYSSTNQELSRGANAVVHTSATLGIPEENPYLEQTELFMTTPDFMADVVQRAMLPHNQETHWVEDTNPLDLLEKLHAKNADFSRIDGIINVGGICKEASSKDWAEAVIAFSKRHQLDYAGAIIAKDERIGKGIEKRLYIVRPDLPDVAIQGSDVKLALQKLDLSNQRFFKVYSPEMTVGTDLSLNPNAKMLIIPGENTPISAVVQAIMRMRGFLQNPIDPKTSQSLIWVGTKKLENMLLERYGKATPTEALVNAISCQSTLEKDAIRMRAIQDIEMVIRNIVDKIIEKSPYEFSRYEGAFKIKMDNDPSKKYGVQITLVDTEAYLMKYANNFAFGAGINLNDYPEEKKRIEAAIKQVKQKVNVMESPAKASLGATLHQHQEVQQNQDQQVQQKQRQFSLSTDYYKAVQEENYPTESLRIGKATSLVPKAEYLANKVLGTNWFLPNLYLLPNFYQTIEGSHNGKNLKASTFILGTLDKSTGKRDYRLISAKDAKYYTKQLRDKNRVNEVEQTAVLFTSNGSIHQTDRSAACLSSKEFEEWQQSEEFRNVIAQVGLIDGRIIEQKRQKNLVQNTPKIINDLERIQKNHLFTNDVTNKQNWESLREAVMNGKEAVMSGPTRSTGQNGAKVW